MWLVQLFQILDEPDDERALREERAGEPHDYFDGLLVEVVLRGERRGVDVLNDARACIGLRTP